MAVSYTTRGIVLAKHPYTQWAEFYTIYTRDYGKMKVLCRGSKKITSKLASHLEPLTMTDICFVRGRRHIQIIGSKNVYKYQKIFEDYTKLNHACHIIELMNTLVKYEDTDTALYKLLEQCLYILEYIEEDHNVLNYVFSFLTFSLMGFTPEIERCVFCPRELPEKRVHFSVHDGGVVCDSCFNERQGVHGIPLYKHELVLLRKLIDTHFEAFNQENHDFKRLIPLFKQCIQYYTDRSLKTAIYL